MSDFLARGTSETPVINANGAPFSPEMGERLREMVKWAKPEQLNARMHPAQCAAIENLGIVVETVVKLPVENVSAASMRLVGNINAPRFFLGFPVVVCLECPPDKILLVSPNKPKTADGETMDPLIVAAIINLGLPAPTAVVRMFCDGQEVPAKSVVRRDNRIVTTF